MSPLCVRMLLHYHYSPIDYRQAEQKPHALSPAVSDALHWFAQQGLLKSRYGDLSWTAYQAHDDEKSEFPLFTITDKGRAMVDAICDVQVPVCKWVQPERTA